MKESLSKRLATKEDLYKLREELKEDIHRLEMQMHKMEKEILTLKILLWVVVILTGASFFPQLLNLLRLFK